jgi:hypothetical protein
MLTRPETTLAIRRGATRVLRQHGFAVVSEMTLGNGRRADLMALKPDGTLWIVEIKSGLADFRADLKWPDYAPYCDALAFAVGADFPLELIGAPTGLIVADAFGGEIIRPPQAEILAPARRKALTLQFARLAASRLMATDDPEFEG